MYGTKFMDKFGKLVKIEMHDFATNGAEWSADFFEVGGLKYDAEYDAYEVDDVEYLIDYADDWKHLLGDFADDDERGGRTEDRYVDVTRMSYVCDDDGYCVETFDEEWEAINYVIRSGDDYIVFGTDGRIVEF